jgi:hypothetical protein
MTTSINTINTIARNSEIKILNTLVRSLLKKVSMQGMDEKTVVARATAKNQLRKVRSLLYNIAA